MFKKIFTTLGSATLLYALFIGVASVPHKASGWQSSMMSVAEAAPRRGGARRGGARRPHVPNYRKAHRHARRVLPRHRFVRILPRGCVARFIRGVNYRYCGGLFYRLTYDGPNVIYVIVDDLD